MMERSQYVILEGEMGHQDAIIRTESVAESLKKEQGDCIGKTKLLDCKLESCPGTDENDAADWRI